MDKMTLKDIEADPCSFCYACDWETTSDCYKGNPAQCSVCSVILHVIEKTKQVEPYEEAN